MFDWDDGLAIGADHMRHEVNFSDEPLVIGGAFEPVQFSDFQLDVDGHETDGSFSFEEDGSIEGKPWISDDILRLPPQGNDPTRVDDVIVIGYRPPNPLEDYARWLAWESQGHPRALMDQVGSWMDPAGDTYEYCGGQEVSGPQPEGDLDAIRSLADGIADIMRTMGLSREHSSLIFLMPDGTLGATLITHGTNQSTAPISLSQLPDGARLVAWVHSHPSVAGIDGRYPSDENSAVNGIGDWNARDQLVSLGAQSSRVSVDPNMLIYIHDVATRKTYEYDKDDRDTNSVGENVSCSN